MSLKINLFIEKIIARMNLDDVQRIEVEQEIKSHLDEAVEQQLRNGLTPEQAEFEAILAFGQPSVIARQFGILQGTGWMFFEWFAKAIPLYIFLCFFSKPLLAREPVFASFPYASTMNYVFMLLLTCIFICRTEWNRVKINGSLQIFRFFQRNISIPFDSIKEIRFTEERLHLFGARKITISHVNGNTVIPCKIRNIRCAALALIALVPQTMNPAVRDYFQHFSMNTRKEKPAIKWSLTLLWILVLVFLGRAFPATWTLRGLSPWLLAVIPIASITSLVQSLFHVDRAKKSVSWIILAGMIFSISVFGILFANWHTYYARWIILFLFIYSIYALSLLWWTGQRTHLLWSFAVIALLLSGLCYRSVPGWKDHTYLRNTHLCLVDNGTWQNPVKQIYADLGFNYQNNEQAYCLRFTSLNSASFHDLEKGQWALLSCYDQDTLTLAYNRENISSMPSDSARLYNTDIFYCKADSQMIYLDSCKYHWGVMFFTANPGFPFWSPQNKFYLLPQQSEIQAAQKVADLKIVSLGDKASKIYENMFCNQIWWVDDHTLRVLSGIHNKQTDNRTDHYEIWRIDAKSGEKILERKLIFDGYPTNYLSKSYIYFCNTKNQSITVRLNLNTGAFENMGESIEVLDSSRDTDNMAYILRQGNQRRIVFENSSGQKRGWLLRANENIGEVSFAHDGKHVFYSEQDGGGVIMGGLKSYNIFDFDNNKRAVLMNLNHLQTIFSANDIHKNAHWTPDGKALMFSAFFWQQVN